jgi:hypothetical protein
LYQTLRLMTAIPAQDKTNPGILAKIAESKFTCMPIDPLAGMKKAAATDVVW